MRNGCTYLGRGVLRSCGVRDEFLVSVFSSSLARLSSVKLASSLRSNATAEGPRSSLMRVVSSTRHLTSIAIFNNDGIINFYGYYIILRFCAKPQKWQTLVPAKISDLNVLYSVSVPGTQQQQRGGVEWSYL